MKLTLKLACRHWKYAQPMVALKYIKSQWVFKASETLKKTSSRRIGVVTDEFHNEKKQKL